MRDLKHLIAFENLLQEANNELVRQGKADGKRALGYTCYFMPEVLLDLPGCFAVRLRAPKCTSPDMATYYMYLPLRPQPLRARTRRRLQLPGR